MPYTGFSVNLGLSHICVQNLLTVANTFSFPSFCVVTISAACNVLLCKATPLPPVLVSSVNCNLLLEICHEQKVLQPVFTPRQIVLFPSSATQYHGSFFDEFIFPQLISP